MKITHSDQDGIRRGVVCFEVALYVIAGDLGECLRPASSRKAVGVEAIGDTVNFFQEVAPGIPLDKLLTLLEDDGFFLLKLGRADPECRHPGGFGCQGMLQFSP